MPEIELWTRRDERRVHHEGYMGKEGQYNIRGLDALLRGFFFWESGFLCFWGILLPTFAGSWAALDEPSNDVCLGGEYFSSIYRTGQRVASFAKSNDSRLHHLHFVIGR